ncbi:MAG: PepSY domain-containing protein [Myxococcota bacterium]
MEASGERFVSPARRATILRWIRRLHLYCGLAMLPWVLLYAVSGFLFNHPAVSSKPGIHRFTKQQLPPSILAPMPDPAAAAAAATEQLRLHATEATIEPRAEPAPSYVGSLSARGKQQEQELSVFLSTKTGNGSVRLSPAELEPVPDALASLEEISVDSLDPAVFEGIARAIAQQYVGEPTELSLSRAPKLRFGLTIDGEPWILTFNPKARTLEYERADIEPEVRLPRVLARLHMTHVYPASFGVAWIHALIVDLTIFCLVLWCVTGLVMWWQLRRLRRIGWVIMLSGLVASVWLLVLVWPSMIG